MSKIRIYDLAKELKLDNKQVIEEVRRLGCEVKVASNSVPAEIADQVRKFHFPAKAVRTGPVKSSVPEQQISVVPKPKLIKAIKKVEISTIEESTVDIGDQSEISEVPISETPEITEVVLEQAIPESESSVSVKPKIVKIKIPVFSSEEVSAKEESKQSQSSSRISTLREIHVPVAPPALASSSISETAGKATVNIKPIDLPAAVIKSQKEVEIEKIPKKREISFQPPVPGQSFRPSFKPREENKKIASSTGQLNQEGPGASSVAATAPQRTTYIPPKDQRGSKGRGRVVGKGVGAAGKREHHEKELSLKTGRTITVAPKPVFTEFKPIKVTEGTTVKELAERLEIKPKDIVAFLFGKGMMVTINQALSEEIMHEVGREFGFDVTEAGFEEMVAEQEIGSDVIGTDEQLERRAPVVTVMGHVDHGKTSLLDAIRNTQVAAGEAGGITQHIGAYSVLVPDPDNPELKRRVVFLDTPGHEAFTLMRARGAKGADVAVIVVAADDGVMPQTIEAIDHARAAGVPLVVAINKIDKPEINIDRVKTELAEHGLLWDGWGGDTVMVEISAKKRINLESLLEMILLTSDILDLKANPKRLASGVVLEARLDRGRGPIASVLVQQGTLHIGDPIIAGLNFGRVRALFDDHGRNVQDAGPAVPVEILGFQGVPQAGDLIQVVNDPGKAQEIAVWRQGKHRIAQLMGGAGKGLENVFEQMQSGSLKELLVILKADVQGSVEVLRDTLEKLSTEKVKVRVIRADVGAITESDVLLASASNDMAHTSVIIGFNVRPAPRVSDLAKQEKVDIRLHTIIYKVEEEMRKAMIGLLDPTTREVYIGRATVQQVIKVAKVGNIAGCIVADGVIKRTSQVRVLRDSVIMFEGKLGSLRRFKEDTAEVRSGFECGIGIENFNDIKVGDVLEVFTTEKVIPTEL